MLVSLVTVACKMTVESSAYKNPSIIIDDFVKSPSAALRFIFSHSDVPLSTPHS
jgi:hypothetical protein